jgi:hypothetical protein
LLFRECWYNEIGKEACPICHVRDITTVKTIETDVCKDGSGHKYIITAKCFPCDIEYQFYQDDIATPLHYHPEEKKLEAYKETTKIPTDETTATTKKKRSKSKKALVEDLAMEIAEGLIIDKVG